MLILILMNVKYLQDVALSFEKSLNGQNHSSSGSHHPIEKSRPAKFPILPTGVICQPLNTFWKTLSC